MDPLLASLASGAFGAVLGAVVNELLARRRGARTRARKELRRLRSDLTRVSAAVAVTTAEVSGLAARVTDVLSRLDHEERNHQ